MKWLRKVATTPLAGIAKVIDSMQAQANERTNAPSIHAVREYISDHIADLYPVGSIYLSVNPDNPTNLFGGTWVQIKDTFLLAAGDTYAAGSTGGAGTHTHGGGVTVGNHVLTTAEIPSHTHNIAGTTVPLPSGNYIATSWSDFGVTEGSAPGTRITSGAGSLELVAGASNTGGGGAHNHSASMTINNASSLPPFLAIYAWKRTA